MMNDENFFVRNKNLILACLNHYFKGYVDEDILQSSYLGFYKALSRYDKEKGTFGQWVWFWIRKEVQKEFNTRRKTNLEFYADSYDICERIELRKLLNWFLRKYLNKIEIEIVIRRIIFEEDFTVISKDTGLKEIESRKLFYKCIRLLRRRKNELKSELEI